MPTGRVNLTAFLFMKKFSPDFVKMPVLSKGDAMRGLAIFIGDIRNCRSKEQEHRRINKELANIQSKFKVCCKTLSFSQPEYSLFAADEGTNSETAGRTAIQNIYTYIDYFLSSHVDSRSFAESNHISAAVVGDKSVDGYNKKKYVCKLLFIFLLGYDIDFGHMEAVNLTTSNRFTEKQMGYLFISVLIDSSSDLFRLIIQNIKNDLTSLNPVNISLALQCIANVGSVEMAEVFISEVPKLLVSGQASESVKQSAALCLLKLFRAAPDSLNHGEWAPKLIHLLNDHQMGVVTASASLLEALAQHRPEEYKGCVPFAVNRLSRIVTALHTDQLDYTYYMVPAPWVCVKLLRLLQCYPLSDDAAVKASLIECLEAVLNRCQEPPKLKRIQHSNAKNAVLFEAIYLIIHIDCEQNLLVRSCDQLGHFLQHRETNLRYLALESLCRLAGSEFSLDTIKKHRGTVIRALKYERDISVRQRAVDLLYTMCDTSNVKEIISEMLQYLEHSDYSIREEMVLKIAILAEKYALDCKWYVDVILQLISISGDYVSEEVWYRVIQIIVNREDVQAYSAKTVLAKMQVPFCHENMIKVGAFVLGEFGNLIAKNDTAMPILQFRLLHSKYHLCSPPTRALLLSAYIKFVKIFPDLKLEIQEVLKNDNQLRNADIELQQRAVEYSQLCSKVSSNLLATVLKEMPPFQERESSILAKLKKKKPSIVDIVETKNGMLSSHLNLAGKRLDEQNVPKLSGSFSTHAIGEKATHATDEKVASLVDLEHSSDPLDKISSERYLQDAVTTTMTIEHEMEFLTKFLFKNSGILHEDDFIQVGVKSEFKEHIGRISFFFGNKTPNQLMDFTADWQHTGDTEEKLDIHVQKPAPSFINGGDQVQFVVSVDCLQVFKDTPLVKISFNHVGSAHSTFLKFPVLISKFFLPVEMTSVDFFNRWKQLGLNSQECQKIFPANFDINVQQSKNKFTGLGLACLRDIDPNPENLVGTGIVKTASSGIGCLLRLEPNEQLQMYRLTIRTNHPELSSILGNLLENQF